MLVVLMAGGRGLRLHPLTAKLPKPMLHVGEKPIIQQILEDYRSQGFNRFFMCLGYKADVIQGHFGDGSFWGVEIAYSVEQLGEPLGTAGALRHIGYGTEPVIVQNADILTKIDYIDLVASHRASKCDATVCAANHMYQVPYGVLESAGDRLVRTAEKPIVSWPVNAGIYVLSPKAVAMVPEGPSDMPDLLDRLDSVSVYQIRNHWTDVGTFESLERARSAA